MNNYSVHGSRTGPDLIGRLDFVEPIILAGLAGSTEYDWFIPRENDWFNVSDIGMRQDTSDGYCLPNHSKLKITVFFKYKRLDRALQRDETLDCVSRCLISIIARKYKTDCSARLTA